MRQVLGAYVLFVASVYAMEPAPEESKESSLSGYLTQKTRNALDKKSPTKATGDVVEERPRSRSLYESTSKKNEKPVKEVTSLGSSQAKYENARHLYRENLQKVIAANAAICLWQAELANVNTNAKLVLRKIDEQKEELASAWAYVKTYHLRMQKALAPQQSTLTNEHFEQAELLIRGEKWQKLEEYLPCLKIMRSS